jgi:hypothetical protein
MSPGPVGVPQCLAYYSDIAHARSVGGGQGGLGAGSLASAGNGQFGRGHAR